MIIDTVCKSAVGSTKGIGGEVWAIIDMFLGNVNFVLCLVIRVEELLASQEDFPGKDDKNSVEMLVVSVMDLISTQFTNLAILDAGMSITVSMLLPSTKSFIYDSEISTRPGNERTYEADFFGVQERINGTKTGERNGSLCNEQNVSSQPLSGKLMCNSVCSPFPGFLLLFFVWYRCS